MHHDSHASTRRELRAQERALAEAGRGPVTSAAPVLSTRRERRDAERAGRIDRRESPAPASTPSLPTSVPASRPETNQSSTPALVLAEVDAESSECEGTGLHNLDVEGATIRSGRPHRSGKTALRFAGGVLGLGIAGSVAAFAALPATAVPTNHDRVAETGAAALVQPASGAPSQTLTVTGEGTSARERDSVYSVTTVGSAATANLATLVDNGAFANNLSAPVQWPFPVGVAITDDFGPRVSPGGIGSTNHMGVDFAPAQGTPIGAIADGVVTSVTPTDNGGLGVNITLEHVIDGATYRSVYAHMLEGSATLQVGAVVGVGDQIGQVGNTGTSTGPHLHLEVQDAAGQKLDGLAFLKQYNTPSTVVSPPLVGAGV